MQYSRPEMLFMIALASATGLVALCLTRLWLKRRRWRLAVATGCLTLLNGAVVAHELVLLMSAPRAATALNNDADAIHDATADTIDAARVHRDGADATYMIHQPRSGCPEGWRPVKNMFVEADGSREAGCVTGTGAHGSIDVLKAGESVRFGIEIIPLPPLPPRSRA
jgi:hypothetical protein